MSNSDGSAAASTRNTGPLKNTHCFINAGLFPPDDEKETILKATNILKQKLFTEDLKKKKGTKSMLSLKMMVMSQIKVGREGDGL